MSISGFVRAAIVATSVALAPAALGAQRTFVSTSGIDTNACSVAAPCRSFAAALVQTDPNGEIVVLDSGGYGAVTVNQPVTIASPSGVYAGISVFAATNGVDVNAPGGLVVLRGLTINGQGGNKGVNVVDVGRLRIEGCTIANTTFGIYMATGSVSVADSYVRDNSFAGIYAFGAAELHVSRTRFDRNAAVAGNGTVSLDNGVVASISDSVIADSQSYGVRIGTTAGGVTSRVSIRRTEIVGGNDHGLFVTASNGSSRAYVADSTFYRNAGSGLRAETFGGGTTYIGASGSVVSTNAGAGIGAYSTGSTVVVTRNTIVDNALAGLIQSVSSIILSSIDNVLQGNNGGGGPETLGTITALSPAYH